MYSSAIHGDLDASPGQKRRQALSVLATIALHLAILLLALFLSGRHTRQIREPAPLSVFDVVPQPIPPPVAPEAKPKDRTSKPAGGGNAPRPAAAPVAPRSIFEKPVRPDVTFDATAPPLPAPTISVDEAAVGLAGLRAASGAGSGGIGTGRGTGTGDGVGGGTGRGGGGVSAPRRTTWLHYPTPAETRRYWPAVALQKRRSGRVLLSCIVPRPGPPKRCTVAAETPQGHGFGAAALQMSAIFLIRPVTRDEVTVDMPILVPVLFDPQILAKP